MYGALFHLKPIVTTTFNLCKASYQLILFHQALIDLVHPAGSDLKVTNQVLTFLYLHEIQGTSS